MKYILSFILFLCINFTIASQAQYPGTAHLRSLNSLFPNLNENQITEIFGDDGLVIAHRKNQPLSLIPSPNSGLNLHTTISNMNLLYLNESLTMIPYPGRILRDIDSYNVLQRIGALQGRLYQSHSRGSTPLFTEATRITSDRRNSLPDPAPSTALPTSETVYIRLRDTNFGNTFYQADFTRMPYGVAYSLTNTRTITYLLFTVMREGRFNAILYMEPLQEGVLVYSVAGADVSDFVAGLIDIPSAVSKRLDVFIGWVGDGIRGM